MRRRALAVQGSEPTGTASPPPKELLVNAADSRGRQPPVVAPEDSCEKRAHDRFKLLPYRCLSGRWNVVWYDSSDHLLRVGSSGGKAPGKHGVSNELFLVRFAALPPGVLDHFGYNVCVDGYLFWHGWLLIRRFLPQFFATFFALREHLFQVALESLHRLTVSTFKPVVVVGCLFHFGNIPLRSASTQSG